MGAGWEFCGPDATDAMNATSATPAAPAANPNWNGRWTHLRKVLERGGPLAHPDFQASPEILDFLLENCKVSFLFFSFLFCPFDSFFVLFFFVTEFGWLHFVCFLDLLDFNGLYLDLLFLLAIVLGSTWIDPIFAVFFTGFIWYFFLVFRLHNFF